MPNQEITSRMDNLKMFRRIVEKAGTQTHLELVRFEYVIVAATLATLPEFGIVGQRREGNRTEPQFIVHLHHGCSGGDAEYLGFGEALARELEDAALDAHRKSLPPESVGYY